MKLTQTVAALLTALIVSTSGQAIEANLQSTANGADSFGWYCKNNDAHQPPVLPSEFSFIGDYGGYYLDTDATEDDRVIYLTFDAGYENGNITKILDVLAAHGATGAFFVLGNLVKRNPELIQRMVAEGHLICNHTNRHPDMTKVTDYQAFREELEALNVILKDCCDVEAAPFYRPPEGKFTRENLKFASDCGYKTIFWSFAYADWDNEKQPDPEKALKKLLDHTHNGEVLLLHPTSATNAAILDEYLTSLEKDGYRFGTLYELIETS